jgi:predicted metal-dependent hydrolase
VQPDGRVIVDSPSDTSISDVKQALLKRARWVLAQIGKTEAQQRYALPRLYVSGETHWYLGRRYLLKVKHKKGEQPKTKLKGGQLLVTLPKVKTEGSNIKLREKIRQQLNDWYLQRAVDVFNRRLDTISRDLSWVRQKPVWQFRRMQKQWGSCSPAGKLSLNPLLVKAPRDCIDYIILHELCHLKHHNHSREFYQLLKQTNPQWESVKLRLDELSEQILIQ